MAEKEKNLHEKHRERLRKTFRDEGLSALTNIQALELLLTYAIPRRDTNPDAHRLLDRFHDFRGVLEADYHELLQVEGIGPESALLITLLTEMNRRYLRTKRTAGKKLESSDDACEYVKNLFRYERVEEVYMLCLDNDNRVLSEHRLGAGAVNHVGLPVREMVEIALREKAARVILTHNHITDFAVPSSADVESTKKVYHGLRLIGVELADHIIVADDDAVSMRDSGYFASF